jgi:hypothetical protein
MTRVWQRFLGGFVALLPAVAMAAPITTQGTWYGTNGWDGTLRGRDAGGNPVNLLDASGTAPNPALKYVYDTALDLTWLADWNVNGTMSWSAANAWASSLTNFGGGWVLPGVLDTGAPGCEFAYFGRDCGYYVYGGEAERQTESPLAHIYYDILGNKGYFDATGNTPSDWGLTNTGPFSNMLPDIYWSGTQYALAPASDSWGFFTLIGYQHPFSQYGGHFAVAVRLGDVPAGSVPEPEALALLGLAFGALALVRRRAH